MPAFVLGKDFTMETKIGLYSNLLYRIDSGNTGKAFGERAWNIHLRFCQMLCPYVRSPKSAAMPKSSHCGIYFLNFIMPQFARIAA
jgi:hypothetical protein